MKNQSLAAPLLEQPTPSTTKHATNTRQRPWFCMACAILGLIVGFLSQRNDLSIYLITFVFQHTTNVVLLCTFSATVATVQLMVFYALLRAVVGHQEVSQDQDMDRYFGMGGIAGVSASCMGMPVWAWLLMTFLGVSLFRVLLSIFEETIDDEETIEDDEETVASIVSMDYSLTIV